MQTLIEHDDLRRRGAELTAGPTPSVQRLHELGERLSAHIRHEERVLYPLVEDALPKAELVELGRAMERAERDP